MALELMIVLFILFGIALIVVPKDVIDIWEAWYSLWGLKMDRKSFMWSNTVARIAGFGTILSAIFMYLQFKQILPS